MIEKTSHRHYMRHQVDDGFYGVLRSEPTAERLPRAAETGTTTRDT